MSAPTPTADIKAWVVKVRHPHYANGRWIHDSSHATQLAALTAIRDSTLPDAWSFGIYEVPARYDAAHRPIIRPVERQ